MQFRIYPRALVLPAVLVGLLLSLPLRAQQSSSNSSGQSQNSNQTGNQNQQNSNSSSKPSNDDNAFPEDVSRKAAQAAAQEKKADGSPDAPPPASPADSQPSSSGSGTPQKSSADDNPFPEATSRKAADAAKSAADSSGVSSSSDYDDRANNGRESVQPNVAMPHIHNKDLTREDIQVGTYYLQSGDYVGAYARFKEVTTLHPENTDAMFGLAEAARHLQKNEEAEANYRLFLDVVPSGSKAKDARKALASLEKSH